MFKVEKKCRYCGGVSRIEQEEFEFVTYWVCKKKTCMKDRGWKKKKLKLNHCANCDSLMTKTNNKYCSKECVKIGRRNTFKEKGKTRKNASKRQRLSKEIRQYVINKYKGLCDECGDEGKHIHHRKPISELPKAQFVTSNLRLLCVPCHRKKHPELPSHLFIKETRYEYAT